MKRRINYTGRKRILRENVNMVLNRPVGSATSFSLTIDLAKMYLPPDAKVYVEAYHRTESKRYDFGSVQSIVPPTDTRLDTFAYPENLKFRIKVVRTPDGLILAHADKLKPETGEEEKPILPVEFADLGQQVWQVSFGGDDGSPILLLNSTIPNIQGMARTDPKFLTYVYPAVIREVLMHMIFVDGVSLPEPEHEWQQDWLEFARRVLPGEPSPKILTPEDDDFDDEQAEDWINKLVAEFCISRRDVWRGYTAQLVGEEGQ